VRIILSKKTLMKPETIGMVFGISLTIRDNDFLNKNLIKINNILPFFIKNYNKVFKGNHKILKKLRNK
jgi:hypothetical protein